MKQNKFLIISSGHNVERYAQAAIDSVKSQTYINFEAVFIDDASTDGTMNIFSRSGFDCWRNETRQGIVRSRNVIPDDDVIMVWFDPDDQLVSKALEVLNAAYQDEEVWMTYGNFVTTEGLVPFPSAQLPDEFLNAPRQNDFRFLPLRSFRAKLYKNLTQEDLVPNPEFKIYPDANMLICLMEMAGSSHIKAIDEVLYIYNMNNPLNVARLYTPDQRAEEHARFKAIKPKEKLHAL